MDIPKIAYTNETHINYLTKQPFSNTWWEYNILYKQLDFIQPRQNVSEKFRETTEYSQIQGKAGGGCLATIKIQFWVHL